MCICVYVCMYMISMCMYAYICTSVEELQAEIGMPSGQVRRYKVVIAVAQRIGRVIGSMRIACAVRVGDGIASEE
jgi:hypothetical protein